MNQSHPCRLLGLSLAAAAVCFGAAPLSAASVDELLAQLRVEVERQVAEAKASKNGSSAMIYDSERTVGRLEDAINRESGDEIDSVLRQLTTSRLSPAAKELISQLQKEAPKFIDERQKAFAEQVSAGIEKAAKACRQAKTAPEMETAIAQFSALKPRNQNGRTTEQQTRLVQRIDSVLRFMTRWQDSILQASAGYDGAARNILRELADPSSSYSGNQNYPLLTRAEIVARMGKESEATVEDILRGVKTLDELPKAIADLQRLSQEPRRGVSMMEINSPVGELTQISRGHNAFKGGAYDGALASVSTDAPYVQAIGSSPELTRLRNLLLTEVLPKYLELPDDPKPKANENASDFLLRLAKESAGKEDWARVARILDAYRQVAFGRVQTPAWVDADIDACENFASAANLEKAGRFAAAIQAYQKVLTKIGRYAPTAAANDRLLALQKSQPEAFKETGQLGPMKEALDAILSQRKARAPQSPE